MRQPLYKPGTMAIALIPGLWHSIETIVLIISSKPYDGFKNPGFSYVVYLPKKQRTIQIEDYQIKGILGENISNEDET